MNITEDDLKTLEAIPAAFMKNVLEQSGMSRDEAYKAYVGHLSVGEKAALMAAKLKLEFAKNADPETKARRIVDFCDKAVPSLTKVFGEQALIDAFPENGRSQHMVDLTTELGGKHIPALIRKTL